MIPMPLAWTLLIMRVAALIRLQGMTKELFLPECFSYFGKIHVTYIVLNSSVTVAHGY